MVDKNSNIKLGINGHLTIPINTTYYLFPCLIMDRHIGL